MTVPTAGRRGRRGFRSIEDRRRYEKALRVARQYNRLCRSNGLTVSPMDKARAILDLDDDQFFDLIQLAYENYAPHKNPTRPTSNATRHAVVSYYLRRA